jgi:hypothetical protein
MCDYVASRKPNIGPQGSREVSMRSPSVFLAVLLPTVVACSEYDLNRPNEPEHKNEVDTGDSEPPPNDAPDIEVEPASLDFGYVLKDCDSDPQDVTISNVGDADLVVDSIQLVGSSTSVFAVMGVPAIDTLAPGDSAVLSVVFTPTAWVSYDAVEIEIVSNDPDEGTVYVPTLGVGSEDPYFEDTFQQGEPGPVDILWVVDNSGSMEDEILRVKNEFEVFIGEFVNMNLDFHLGAITTDMDFPDDSGRLQGDPIYFDNTFADPEGAFGTTIDEIYNQTGSGDERGLDAVKAALTEPLLSSDNAGFYRDTTEDGTPVAIHTIVVTDEDDGSSLSSSNFATWYNGLKPDPDTANFSAICGDPATSMLDFGGCMEWDSSSGRMLEASAGTKYIEVVDATGGYWASICTAEFSEALQYLSLETMGMSAVYELTYEPSSIALMTVQVNGAAVSYSAVDGWTYTTDNNAVNFHGEAIPEPSADIYVHYPYDGGC